jgi:hypothetical protein
MSASRTKTSPTAASSRVPLIPSKTLIASALNPADPVTATCRPSRSFSRSRRSSTGSRIVADSPSVFSGATSSADVPSSDGTGRRTAPSCG